MVSRTFKIRSIQDEDRRENAWRIAKAEERGDFEEAEIIRNSFAEWENEQGQERERLVCAICGDSLLSPTKRGTARPHRRRDVVATWDRARQLREDIKSLQAELDRVLDALEP